MRGERGRNGIEIEKIRMSEKDKEYKYMLCSAGIGNSGKGEKNQVSLFYCY